VNAPSSSRAPRRRHAARGFTLIELMITVAIVAILARVALPSYLEYIKRGKMTEAFNTLSTFSLAMGQWYQDNRTFVGACGTSGLAAAPTGQNFTYDCPTLTATAYTIRATGQNSLAGFTFTLDQNGVRQTTATASGSGWPTNTTCWVSNKSGTCY